MQSTLMKTNNHEFGWFVLSQAHKSYFKLKIMKACFIKLVKPSLNNHLNNNTLTQFHYGIT